jgi:chromosome segregation ATPase
MMKIYTSEVAQHGKTIQVLNEEVKFDNTGCAEVDDKFAKRLMDYSEWFTSSRPKLKEIAPKEFEVKDVLNQQELEATKLEVEKLKKMNDSRKEKAGNLQKEIDDLRSELGKVVKERDAIKEDLDNKEEVVKKEIENLKYKYELALLGVNELRATCKELGIKEDFYKQEKDKEKLIDLIIKAAE